MSMTFADLSLAPTLLRALAEDGYATPTPIQARSILMLLQGRDVLGMAESETSAFEWKEAKSGHPSAGNSIRHYRFCSDL